jgi:hypothetical protein
LIKTGSLIKGAVFGKKVAEEVLKVRHFYELMVYENSMKAPKYNS